MPREGAGDDGVRRPSSHRSDRSGRHHHHHGGFYGGWWDPWFYRSGWGGWWGGWGWGWGWWGPWGPAGVVYDGPYRSGRGSGYGAIDTDIWPGKAEIYVDGQRVGTADDFDGFPSYLWLPRGTYDIAVYYPGFRTLSRQMSIYDGLVIDFDERMEQGDAVRPEDLPAKTTERRDERLRNEAEMQERARRRDDWRRKQAEADSASAVDPGPAGAAPELDQGGAARLHLIVVPRDASVYLDGNFIGTGAELAQLSAGVVVAPGSHRLEVVRPGYEAKELDFEGAPGEEVRLDVSLEED